jgi:ABC-type dipeptide/oligopeptide/nickel transport system permease component
VERIVEMSPQIKLFLIAFMFFLAIAVALPRGFWLLLQWKENKKKRYFYSGIASISAGIYFFILALVLQILQMSQSAI